MTAAEYIFEAIPKPENAKPFNNAIAPAETDEPFERTYRISKAFEKPFSAGYDKNHNLAQETVGTNNIGLPPAIASYLQEMRDSTIDPSNSYDVSFFQQQTSYITTLLVPALLSHIYADSSVLDLEVRLMNRNIGELKENCCDYMELIRQNSSLTDTRRTIGGSLSRAAIFPGFFNYVPKLVPKIQLENHINIIDVQRAGTLPSLVLQYNLKKFGLSADIWSIDAKRKHSKDGAVDNIALLPPIGYEKSGNSTLVSGYFAAPSNPKPADKHIMLDPMLATGKSARKVLEQYIEEVGCNTADITFLSLFAGSYDGLFELEPLGINILVLAHDQADLNIKGYIQPGLGDAGDKLAGSQGIINNTSLVAAYKNIFFGNRGISKVFDKYSRQLTGQAL